MKKIILIFLVIFNVLNARETNTHRAIDQTAMKHTSNLASFITDSQLKDENYINEKFEGYKDERFGGTITYFNYFNEERSSDAMADWNQTFINGKYQDLIEAGSMLEDAVWSNAWVSWNGRFNNHFYESQNNGKGLTWGYGADRVNAVKWATGYSSYSGPNPYEQPTRNTYDYTDAMSYFSRGFSEPKKEDRTKYQAKMFVSVGHILHLVNDMNVPAHVRDDSHPEGDLLEVWMRGGERGDRRIGFYVKGSEVTGSIPKTMGTITPQENFSEYMKAEAKYTSENFFSRSVMYKMFDSDYLPNKEMTTTTPEVDIGYGVKKHYVLNQHGVKIAIGLDSFICGYMIAYDRGSSCAGFLFHGDYSVVEDTGKVLIPRAIANAAGFVNYFFRGSMDAKITQCGIIIVKNDSSTSLMADANVTTFKKGGTLQVYYDVDRVRKPVFDGPYDPYRLLEDLPSGEEITLPKRLPKEIYDIADNHKFYVVYEGTIGAEAGVAVDIATIEKPPIGSGDKLPDGHFTAKLTWNETQVIMKQKGSGNNNNLIYTTI